MIEKTVAISIPEGLIAKTSTGIIKVANDYPCSIALVAGDRRVNAKSLLGVLSMGLKCGDTVQLVANGEQEAEALQAISSQL